MFNKIKAFASGNKLIGSIIGFMNNGKSSPVAVAPKPQITNVTMTDSTISKSYDGPPQVDIPSPEVVAPVVAPVVEKMVFDFKETLLYPIDIRLDIDFFEEALKYVKHSKKKARIIKRLNTLYKELNECQM